METAAKHGIGLIDMVVVNLYPFEKTVAKPGAGMEEAIENIDIGGPSMLRSAAKNFRSVCVVCDPADYGRVIEEMKRLGGGVSERLLAELGAKVFERTSSYDSAIYCYLRRKNAGAAAKTDAAAFPADLNLSFRKMQDLRYGENPHQKAAFYRDEASREPGISGAVQLHGKELSFNNIIDLDAALEIVKEFDEPAAAIIKHTNPCGAAAAKTLKLAYIDALECDRLSAFGGIVGFNRPVDRDLAETILKETDLVECIIAPSYEAEALEALRSKKNMRLLEAKGFGAGPASHDSDMKKVVGGLLVQDRDTARVGESDLRVVTKARPTAAQVVSMLFGWKVVKHVKSNAIVLCRGTKTVGVGAGQMSRVESVLIAARKAGSRSGGATLASDAFFPKEDGVEAAAKSGIEAIIQPGGSVKDADVIKKADELGIAMVFTGIRHFRH
jgi:phosphoribosylaminoimidazolecarboxamide formyltransferase/IMP cyclohydrolase